MNDVDPVTPVDTAILVCAALNKFSVAGYGEWKWWSECH
jgi:amino acid permease